jgi:hypothetical protein
MEELTLDNFLERTGLRFRVSNEQRAAIKAGTLTREAAFQQALESGELQKRVDEETALRNAWDDPTLTLANFKDRTGRRFRLSRERAKMVEAKLITREEAFAQTVAERRQETQPATTTQETANAE